MKARTLVRAFFCGFVCTVKVRAGLGGYVVCCFLGTLCVIGGVGLECDSVCNSLFYR